MSQTLPQTEAIVVDDPGTWPERLWAALETPDLVERLRGASHVDELNGAPSLGRTTAVAEEIMQERGIAGFHFTKEPYTGCFADGLRVLDMEAHQEETLELLAPHLGAELTERARQRMAEFAASDQRQIREGRLWFCFARSTVSDPGIRKLVRFVGGEAVYWWLWRDPEIGSALERVGQPVVVEATLYPAEMRSGAGQWGLGRSLVSHYAALRVNADFHPWDVETHVTDAVPSRRIVAVHSLDEFRERWG